MAKISVITACYNHGKYLAEAIESVIAQTYINWECIIINDGSTDNSGEVAAQLVEKDKRITYYNKVNGGLSAARNFGIDKSSGEIIFPLDADDKIHPAYFNEAIKAFALPNVKVVYTDIEFFGAKQGLFKLPDFSLQELAIMNMIVGNSFFKKVDFLQAGGYNPNMIYGWEDWNLWVSILKNGGNVFKIQERFFYYRIKENSMLASLEGARKQKMYMQLYLNHPDFFDKYYKEPIEIFPQYQHLYNKLNLLKGLIKFQPSAFKSLSKKINKRFSK